MDVGEWLKGIGLGQYDATFREHEIDAEVLADLTEADLEKFGVPFGHRSASSKRSPGWVSLRLSSLPLRGPRGRFAPTPAGSPRSRMAARRSKQVSPRNRGVCVRNLSPDLGEDRLLETEYGQQNFQADRRRRGSAVACGVSCRHR
jgi:hypothetical protein